MNQNVGLLSGMVCSECGEELLGGAVRCNVKRVESTDGRQFVLEFENTAHEALLVAQIQGDACRRQLLANRPCNGVFTGHSKHKGRFTFQSKHEMPPWGLGVVRYTKPLSVAYQIGPHRPSLGPDVKDRDRPSKVGENIVKFVPVVVGEQVIEF